MARHKWTLLGDPDAGSQSYSWEPYEVKWEWTGLGDEGYWYATHHGRVIKDGGTPPELMDFCESFSERLVTASEEDGGDDEDETILFLDDED